MRMSLFALAVLAASPCLAQTHDHDSHLSEIDGLRVLHVWTQATQTGADALVYMKVENTSDTDALLTGATAMDQPLDLVGFSYGAAGESWTVLPGLPIPAGGDVMLEPQVLALRWTKVPVDLVEGADLDIDIALGGHLLEAEVEIGAADATAHSHAGHNH